MQLFSGTPDSQFLPLQPITYFSLPWLAVLLVREAYLGGWLRFLSWKDLSSWLSYSSQAILLLLSICYYNWLDNYQGEPQRSSWLPNNNLLCSHCVTTTQLSSDDYGKLPLHKWLCLSLTVDLLVQKVQSAWVAAVTLNLMRFLQYSWWKYLCSWKQIL